MIAGLTDESVDGRMIEDRLGPVGGSDRSGNDSPGTNGQGLTVPATSSASVTIPRNITIPTTHNSTQNSYVPKDLTDAKLENNQSHFSGSTSNQGLTQDVPTGPGPVTLIGDTLNRDMDVQNLGNSCSEQFNRDNDSFFISNPIDRQASEPSFETNGNSCLAKNTHETQKRVQKDPPSDSDASVIKKLREDVSDSGESHPSNISVSTALHKDFGDIF